MKEDDISFQDRVFKLDVALTFFSFFDSLRIGYGFPSIPS